MTNSNEPTNVFSLPERLPAKRPKINYVSAPCGSGKTYATCMQIKDEQSVSNQLYVGPSIELLRQTQSTLEKLAVAHVDMITTETHPDHVKRAIVDYLNDSRDCGHILLITWNAYVDLPYFHRRENWSVYIDEVPQLDSFYPFTVPFSSRYIAQHVKIVETIGENIGRVVPRNAARLKTFLDQPHDDVHALFRPFLFEVLSQNRDVFVDLNGWSRVIENSIVSKENDERNRVYFLSMLNAKAFKNATLLGAHIEQSMLFHWLSTRCSASFATCDVIKASLRYTDHDESLAGRLDIHYVLENEHFSKAIRGRPDHLTQRPIIHEIERLANGTFGNDPYLLVANNDYEGQLSDGSRSVRIPVISHGLNAYETYTNLIYLTALNREPKHIWMLKQLGISQDRIRISTGYEVLYQNVMRSNLRDPNSSQTVTIIVPDRGSAEFLRSVFSTASIKRLGSVSHKQQSAPLTQIQRNQRSRFFSKKGWILDKINLTQESLHSFFNLKERNDFKVKTHTHTHLPFIVTFHNEFCDNRSFQFFEHTFESPLKFVKLLKSCAETIFNTKDEGMLLLPGVFESAEDQLGYRLQTNFIHSSLMVLDFDNGDLSPDDFVRMFWTEAGPSNKRSFVICNTWSRSAEQPNRFRVILIYKHPATTIDQHRAIYDSIVDRLNANGFSEESAKLDRCSRNVNQSYWIPGTNRSNPDWAFFQKHGLSQLRDLETYGIDPASYTIAMNVGPSANTA